MPAVKLTDVFIKALRPTPRQRDYWDDMVTGLILRVNPGGSRTFQVCYVTSSKVARRLKLGRYPVVSLSDARLQAKEVLARVASGFDPTADTGGN